MLKPNALDLLKQIRKPRQISRRHAPWQKTKHDIATNARLKPENESHRTWCSNILSKTHACYTKHIQSIFGKQKKTNLLKHTTVHIRSFMFLFLAMKQRSIAHCTEHNMQTTYMLHKTYIIQIWQIKPRSQHTRPYICVCSLRCVVPRNDKESYRKCYSNIINKHHTCDTKHI